MIRLVFCDVDGTLVGKSGVVLPRVWDAADRARARGKRLSLCSGRPGFGVARGYAERLDPDGWHVFQNGASVVHLPTGRSRSSPIAKETIDALVARARAKNRVLELYGDADYVVESADARAKDHAALLGVPFSPRKFEAFTAPIVRAQWLVARHDADAVLAEESYGLEVVPSPSPVMPDTLFVNLTNAGVSKGSAVVAVAAEYGVDLADAMMIGDALNDVGAMKAVGFAVAMGNAEPGVREHARAAVGDVEDGAVADALDLAI